MALKGDFDTLFIDGLLQLLCQYGKTGILSASNGIDQVKIFLKEGQIICVMGSLEDDRLGNMLKRHHLISDSQLQECLHIARDQQKAIGKVLVEKGYLDQETIKAYIDKQAAEIITRMLLWQVGDFEYKDYDLTGEHLLMSRLNMMKILMEASRRIDEMSVFMKMIPSDGIRFKPSIKRSETDALTLTEEERKVLAFIDGQKSVRDIITISGEAEFMIYKSLYSLLSSGLIEVQRQDREADESRKGRIADLIRGYNDIFKTIAAAAPDRSALFEICKTDEAAAYPLLRDFHPNHPLATNIQMIETRLARLPSNVDKRRILLDALNTLLQCLLKQLSRLLDKAKMRRVINDIEHQIGEHLSNG